ncbi:MAG: YqaJ viral recombinase family protein [Salana multivorans]|uniref:YqaJ viral recombinase family protein n=1 Tax=Salana multivorans TaxID=120377 RepID=UPI000961E33D|nr:YqaJ viral recombinase family protein [Salana multivorans]MBN8882989.1 YqaJ viral recombinase family protein [Salana multivorans]OJX94059.1 MAG: hypothetical protein BGO96_09640 [Micrococcales bacterium 73-15]
MTLTIYPDVEQRSDEWYEQRRGIVTASALGNLISAGRPTASDVECPECPAFPGDPCAGKRDGSPLKTMHPARAEAARRDDRTILKVSTGDTAMGYLRTLAAERITGRVVETPTSRAMERGILDEPYARDAYTERTGSVVAEVGFMARDSGLGWRLGYSPDGTVDDDGLIEAKSREPKLQIEHTLHGAVPTENLAQIHGGLYVSGRSWIDYVSYSGGLPLHIVRVYPDMAWRDLIEQAVTYAEQTITDIIARYQAATAGMPTTEYIDHFDLGVTE